MGLDDHAGGGTGGSSSGGGGGTRTDKLDFSQPYLFITRAYEDEVETDIAYSRVHRAGEDKDIVEARQSDYREVLCIFPTSQDWQHFRSKAENQLDDVDIDEVLEHDPAYIADLKAELAQPDPYVETRDCVVCGDELTPGHYPFRELRLARDGQAHMGADHLVVCETHSIGELMDARNGDN